MAKNTKDILADLVSERGAIVSSADCGEMELAFARKGGRFYVDDTGLGYVIRPQRWLLNAEAAIEAVRETDDENDN